MTKTFTFLLTLTLVANLAAMGTMAAFPSAGPDESESESSEAEVIKETKSDTCTGLGALVCVIQAAFNFLVPDQLSLSDAPLSLLFFIHKSALSGTSAGDFGGSITRLLPPNQGTDKDPRAALIQTESQAVSGEILINRLKEGTKDTSSGGTYTVEPTFRIPATFDEIVPIRDKFGFLRQALDPQALTGDFRFALPNVNFGPRNEPGKIDLDETSRFDVQWNAGERTQTVSTSPDPNDPDCQTPPKPGGDGTCNRTGSGELSVSAPLDTATKVSPAAQAGKNLLAVAKLFLPPGAKFKGGDVADGISYEVKYRDQTSEAKIPLEILGGAVNAYRCVTEQLLLPPGSGATGLCDKALVSAPTTLGAQASDESTENSEQVVSTTQSINFWANLGSTIGKFLGFILSL